MGSALLKVSNKGVKSARVLAILIPVAAAGVCIGLHVKPLIALGAILGSGIISVVLWNLSGRRRLIASVHGIVIVCPGEYEVRLPWDDIRRFDSGRVLTIQPKDDEPIQIPWAATDVNKVDLLAKRLNVLLLRHTGGRLRGR